MIFRRNKPVVKVDHVKSDEVLELLVRGQLHNLRKVDLGLERGVGLLVHAVPGALPLEPFVNLWRNFNYIDFDLNLAFAVLFSFKLNMFSTIFFAILMSAVL